MEFRKIFLHCFIFLLLICFLKITFPFLRIFYGLFKLALIIMPFYAALAYYHHKGKLKHLITNISLLILSIIVVLLAIEFGGRLIINRYPTGYAPERFFIFNKSYGWSHRPNATGYWHRYTDGTKNLVLINTDGFSDNQFVKLKDNSKIRICIIGDSVAEAWEVPERKRYIEIMRGKLNKQVEIMNFAVRGYSTDQELLLLMNEVIHYHPDMVMLFFCLNDVEDNFSKKDGKPFYSLVNGQLILNNSPVLVPQKSIRTFDKKDPFRYLCQNSWLFEYTYTRVKILRRLNHKVAFALNKGSTYSRYQIEDNYRLPESDYYCIDETQFIIQRWLLFKEILRRMKVVCDENNIQFAVIGNVTTESTRQYFEVKNKVDYSLPYKQLHALCSVMEIEYVDIMSFVLKRKLSDKDIFNNEENFHYNILGNSLLADILTEFLLKQFAFKVE